MSRVVCLKNDCDYGKRIKKDRLCANTQRAEMSNRGIAYDMCVNAQTDANIRSTLQVVRQLTLELEEKVPSSPVPVSSPSTTIRTLA